MKKLIFILISLLVVSCGKKQTEVSEKRLLQDTLQKIDSINAHRTKYNDSIRALNSQNRYRDYSGTHQFSHSEINKTGTVKFTKIGRDEYKLSGKISSGINSVEISGVGELVTEKYLNFDGKIIQKIDGTTYVRNKKTSFKDEKKGNFWRLQDKVNSDGFVDYIDIYF